MIKKIFGKGSENQISNSYKNH
uniref:Uncharacterized protein n=1 Tax=Rhizophora mucronata TaxID=61149 RepID=A0A2P2NL28_RHIMU